MHYKEMLTNHPKLATTIESTTDWIEWRVLCERGYVVMRITGGDTASITLNGRKLRGLANTSPQDILRRITGFTPAGLQRIADRRRKFCPRCNANRGTHTKYGRFGSTWQACNSCGEIR